MWHKARDPRRERGEITKIDKNQNPTWPPADSNKQETLGRFSEPLGQMDYTEYLCKNYFDRPLQPDPLRSCTHR